MVALSVASFIIVGTTYLGYKTWDTLQIKEVINGKTEQLPSISFSKMDGRLLHFDSLRDTKELLVINYFNPGCDHCKSMVTEMFQEQSRLETVRWLMITSENIETTKPFADSMKLAQLPMVTVISDTALLFAKTFGTTSVPSFYVYEAGKLIRKHKGEMVAIMGENGCGKSTLVQLLMQHYTPEGGNIFINDELSLAEVDRNYWKGHAAIVPQQVHIFNGTVLENIAFDDAGKDPQAVADFLLKYGFAPFIDSLPQSVMTLVGEEGINLSGGQKQMVALARALYHRPKLLILDEATAAMDRESELFVLHLLKRLKPEMGIIIITHRLHVLKSFCDRIYVLDKGTIATMGNHESLLLSNNLYSRYWADINP